MLTKEIFMKIQPKKVKLIDYDIDRIIGIGSYGIVKLAKIKQNGKFVAIKILKKDKMIKFKQVDHVMNEIRVLSTIDHPFLVKTQGYTQDEKYLYIVIDLVNGGDLFTYLREKVRLPLDQVQFYSSQVVLMLEYLHNKGIIYRDLKPENILIDAKGYLKLSDFGFSKVIEDKTFTCCGTPEYMAPEMILNRGHNKSVDWWGFGVLLYELLVGMDPFNDEDPVLIYQKILKGKVLFPSKIAPAAKSLIKHLLEPDFTKRYGSLRAGISDIKTHRFFKDVEWSTLHKYKIKASYIPTLSNNGDCSHFPEVEDLDENEPIAIQMEDDPFEKW